MLRASSISRICSSRRANASLSRALISLARLPKAARSSGGSWPVWRSSSVTSPLRPITRRSQSASASEDAICASSADACWYSTSSLSSIITPLTTNKNPRPLRDASPTRAVPPCLPPTGIPADSRSIHRQRRQTAARPAALLTPGLRSRLRRPTTCPARVGRSPVGSGGNFSEGSRPGLAVSGPDSLRGAGLAYLSPSTPLHMVCSYHCCWSHYAGGGRPCQYAAAPGRSLPPSPFPSTTERHAPRAQPAVLPISGSADQLFLATCHLRLPPLPLPAHLHP